LNSITFLLHISKTFANKKGLVLYFDPTTKIWNCPWDVNPKSNWLITDGTKIVVDTSKALASTTKYKVVTKYYLWCACSGSAYTDTYYEKTATFYFQIQKPPPLTSVTSTQFSSSYTFYVGAGGTIPFPTFTTVPSPTPYSALQFNLHVDGTTLCSNGITVSSLSWLTYDTT
jgi:hypothetical protein